MASVSKFFNSKEPKVFFVHDFDRENETPGGLTVAYRFSKDRMRILYGFAICSTKDKYNKKVGRDLAKSRIGKVTEFNSYVELIDFLQYMSDTTTLLDAMNPQFLVEIATFDVLSKTAINLILVDMIADKIGEKYWRYEEREEEQYDYYDDDEYDDEYEEGDEDYEEEVEEEKENESRKS